MFKKLKKYIELKRRERIEILETLCTICLYLGKVSLIRQPARQDITEHFHSHFRELKAISLELRGADKNEVREIKKYRYR